MSEDSVASSSEALSVDRVLASWVSANPAFAVTIVYLLVSGYGAALQALMFSRLGLNYFDYAQPSDFFVSAFRRPDAVWPVLIYLALWSAVNLPILWAVRNPQRLAEIRTRWWGRFLFHERIGLGRSVAKRANRYAAEAGITFGVLAMMAGIGAGHSMANAARIRHGKMDRQVSLEFVNGSRVDDLAFVGMTSQFVITYDVKEQRPEAWLLGGLRRIQPRAVLAPASQPSEVQ